MKFIPRVSAVLPLFIVTLGSSSALAQLSVQDPTVYGTKPGYIDQSIIVLEPHGAFVEESLYLKYSDHDQYSGNNNIEIVHRFTLPEGAVVNNMWLWIGDTLVEAKMFSTWTARHIYDSIVVRRHDPAFLAKNGNMYEFHVYPLISGRFRETKLDFIVPTQWIGDSGSAELPLALLKGNSAAAKPVQILFREREDIWGSPFVRGFFRQTSQRTFDSAGYIYREFDIPDVSSLSELSVSFQTAFVNGLFATASYRQGDSSYFQIGIDPSSFNVTRSDTDAISAIVGLDLSGSLNNSISSVIPEIRNVIHRALRPIDRFRLVVAGDDTVARISGWQQANSPTIDTVFSDFATSVLAGRISKTWKPTIVYCDAHSQTIWRFSSLDILANIKSYQNIVDASNAFSTADIVASYDHGFESSSQTNANLPMLFARIDSLFSRGGRFLGYFDHNRPSGEKIETHYINGLTEKYPAPTQTLFAQPNGNIGNLFPSSITLNSVNYLTYSDPDVKVELANNQGEAAVISKRIGNGLLVVSGVWSFVDDGALKQMMAVPLLGVSQGNQGTQMVKPLLNDIRTLLNQDSVKEVMFFSNADSLISKTDATSWVNIYLSGIAGGKPVFNTVNLLNGNVFIPPYISENGTDYYGAGYLSNYLSDATGGLHFETHLKSWNSISGELTFSNLAKIDSLHVSVIADDGSGSLFQVREVSPEPNDAARPRFFIGASSAKVKLDFSVGALFKNPSLVKVLPTTAFITVDTTGRMPVIAAMLGWEDLKDLFSRSSSDTSAIVKLALNYNLLCDYTALIALEPKTDTPGSNSDDNGGTNSGTPVVEKTQKPDSLAFAAYPNPFNPQTTFYISLRGLSEVKIIIYNLLGQQVRIFTLSASQGTIKILWDGKDSKGRTVATGIYFARAVITEKTTGLRFQKVLKLSMVK
jgi:hypothetical protein